jgi:hypothetical protein
MWFNGDLTSKKLETLIDSELLIYCLHTDYILSHIRVCIIKTPSSLRLTPPLTCLRTCHCQLCMQLPDHWSHCCSLCLQLHSHWTCCCGLCTCVHSLSLISCLLPSLSSISCHQGSAVLALSSTCHQLLDFLLLQCLSSTQ